MADRDFGELDSVVGVERVTDALDRETDPYVCVTLDVNEYGEISTIHHRGDDPIGSKCIEYGMRVGQIRPQTATTGKMQVWLVPTTDHNEE